MKTNDMNEKLDLNNMQEITPEEMEDVAGGGIKEIVAATTLAAMTMTGGTVSAFNMAQALAEDAGSIHIEQAPEQEAFGTAFEGQMDEIIFVDGDAAEAEVAEVTEMAMGGEEAEPVAEVTVAVAEEAALMEGVAEEAERAVQLSQLIHDTISANRS